MEEFCKKRLCSFQIINVYGYMVYLHATKVRIIDDMSKGDVGSIYAELLEYI